MAESQEQAVESPSLLDLGRSSGPGVAVARGVTRGLRSVIISSTLYWSEIQTRNGDPSCGPELMLEVSERWTNLTPTSRVEVAGDGQGVDFFDPSSHRCISVASNGIRGECAQLAEEIEVDKGSRYWKGVGDAAAPAAVALLQLDPQVVRDVLKDHLPLGAAPLPRLPPDSYLQQGGDPSASWLEAARQDHVHAAMEHLQRSGAVEVDEHTGDLVAVDRAALGRQLPFETSHPVMHTDIRSGQSHWLPTTRFDALLAGEPVWVVGWASAAPQGSATARTCTDLNCSEQQGWTLQLGNKPPSIHESDKGTRLSKGDSEPGPFDVIFMSRERPCERLQSDFHLAAKAMTSSANGRVLRRVVLQVLFAGLCAWQAYFLGRSAVVATYPSVTNGGSSSNRIKQIDIAQFTSKLMAVL